MGMILFLMAGIFEATFAAFCIISKSNHAKERSIIRIASFIGFVLFAVLPIIDWSLRYYALASLLLLLAITGVKALTQEKGDKREYNAVRIVLRAIGMTMLIFAVTFPAIIFPQTKTVVATTGEYQVLTKAYTYTDINRVESYTDTGNNRKLNVQLWYPDNLDETVPLIVFSHGGLALNQAMNHFTMSLQVMVILCARSTIHIKAFTQPTRMETQLGLIWAICRNYSLKIHNQTYSKAMNIIRSG